MSASRRWRAGACCALRPCRPPAPPTRCWAWRRKRAASPSSPRRSTNVDYARRGCIFRTAPACARRGICAKGKGLPKKNPQRQGICRARQGRRQKEPQRQGIYRARKGRRQKEPQRQAAPSPRTRWWRRCSPVARIRGRRAPFCRGRKSFPFPTKTIPSPPCIGWSRTGTAALWRSPPKAACVCTTTPRAFSPTSRPFPSNCTTCTPTAT